MVSIRLEGICKYYEGGEIKANENINLEIKDGEFLTLLGPSGCGKTTTLRQIAGLEKPTKGTVYFDGEPVNDKPPSDRNVAMVFQNYAIYPHMSVRENIEYPLKVRDVSEEERRNRVEDTAEFLEIEKLLDRDPGELSGGQRQRVALGRAIVRDPAAFLLDEPLANLDAKLRVGMRAEMKKLQEELGVTTVYVTHDQTEAMTMSERVAVMKEGVLQQVDPPTELYSRPKKKWVGAFIGSPEMNQVDCSLKVEDGKRILSAEEITIPLKEELADLVERKTSGSELTFGVRPKDISIHEEEPSAPPKMKGEVDTLEPLGEHTIANVTVGDRLLKAKVPPSFAAGPGTEVYLAFDEDSMYIYDENGDLVN